MDKKTKTVTMYLAMDKDGSCCLHTTKPKRFKCDGCEYWVSGKKDYNVPDSLVCDMFSDLKWEDDPIEIEITLKRNE